MSIASMTNSDENKPLTRMTPEQSRSRRARNIAIGLAVAGLVVLFYVITIVKLGGNAIPRAM